MKRPEYCSFCGKPFVGHLATIYEISPQNIHCIFRDEEHHAEGDPWKPKGEA